MCVCLCIPGLHRRKLGKLQVREAGWGGTHTLSCSKPLPFPLREKISRAVVGRDAGVGAVYEGKFHFQGGLDHTLQRARCDYLEEKSSTVA